MAETAEGKEASTYKCCEYFEAALDPNILRAYLGYCKARAWPFTVMVPIGGFERRVSEAPDQEESLSRQGIGVANLREEFERRYGPLWSGASSLSIGGVTHELQR